MDCSATFCASASGLRGNSAGHSCANNCAPNPVNPSKKAAFTRSGKEEGENMRVQKYKAQGAQGCGHL